MPPTNAANKGQGGYGASGSKPVVGGNGSAKFGVSSSSNKAKPGNAAPSKNNNQVTSFSSKQQQQTSSNNNNKRTAAAGVGAGAAAGGDVLSLLVGRALGLQVPVVQPELLQLAMGVLNLFFWGVGVIVCGALNNDLVDVVIGILQLVIPFVGWAWAVLWGILMILALVKK